MATCQLIGLARPPSPLAFRAAGVARAIIRLASRAARFACRKTCQAFPVTRQASGVTGLPFPAMGEAREAIRLASYTAHQAFPVACRAYHKSLQLIDS
nr:MAG: hypothetical protein BECKH772A_GA0070896_1002017 [Candidatus Kentron sp. H]